MKRLDNGMKVSEYLSTPEGRTGLTAFVYSMYNMVYQYPNIYMRVCLYSDGSFIHQTTGIEGDWKLTDDMVAALCECNYSRIPDTLAKIDYDKYVDGIIEILKAEGN